MLRKFYCFIVLLCMVSGVFAGAIHADGISLSQSIDQTEIPFEGETHFDITISWQGPQSAYLFDRPLRPQFENLKAEAYSSTISSTGTGDDEITTKKYSYTLVPTMPGAGRIHPVEVSYLMWPDSIPGQLLTEAIAIRIANPVPVSESDDSYLVWLVVFGGVLFVGLVVFLLLMKRAAVKKAQSAVKTPANVFLDDIAALKNDSGGDLKRFQTGLYKHLSSYLVREYGISDGGSVQELVARLETCNMTESQRQKISGWLVRADKEKFTPVQTAPGETVRLETEIRQFFEKNATGNK